MSNALRMLFAVNPRTVGPGADGVHPRSAHHPRGNRHPPIVGPVVRAWALLGTARATQATL